MAFKKFLSFLPYSIQRKFLDKKNLQSPLIENLEQLSIDLNKSITETEFIALDFETTGLNPKTDSIVSIGFVPIIKNRIILNQSRHYLISQNTPISEQSVVIHKITNQKIEQGHMNLKQGLEVLLSAVKGKIIIAHNAKIEKYFLEEAMLKTYATTLPFYFVDTMKIEMKKATNQYGQKPLSDLRLYQLRKKYKLPQYKAHHALDDAIATAELFLLQMSRFDKSTDSIKLKQII